MNRKKPHISEEEEKLIKKMKKPKQNLLNFKKYTERELEEFMLEELQ